MNNNDPNELLDQNYKQFIELLLPAGILEYFDLIKTTQSPNGLHIYLEERNESPTEYKDVKLHSKGLLDEIRVQDFPIRGTESDVGRKTAALGSCRYWAGC